jgi:hypothetical protein
MNMFWNQSFVKRPLCTAFVLVLSFFVVAPAHAQTDVNFNLYGAFPSSASGPTTMPFPGSTATVPLVPLRQTADPSLGFLMGLRHIFSPHFGLEMDLGYNRAVQHFTGAVTQTGPVYAHGKPFTIDYVYTFPSFRRLRPFAIGGAGFVDYNISSNALLPARAQKIPVGVYGAGFDYAPRSFPKFFGFRFQYRGLLEHAPDFRLTYLSTNQLINIAEPTAGVYLKF